VRREVVTRDLDLGAGAQLLEMRREELALERGRVVVVDLRALLERQVLLVAIIRVVFDRHAAARWHRQRELVRHRGLAGTGTTCDPDNEGA
jgi:hypothetical protein